MNEHLLLLSQGYIEANDPLTSLYAIEQFDQFFSDENCLLLLNVVASNPLSFANPERLKPCDLANCSIASQNKKCVMISPFLTCYQVTIELYPKIPFISSANCILSKKQL